MRSVSVVVAGFAAVGSLGLAGSAMASPTPVSQVGTPGALVVGTFNSSHVRGTSAFIQTADSSFVSVYGTYDRLDKNRPYFTVAYGNGNCDPAQAFPVGPFTADKKGRAVLAAGVPSMVSLAGSGSVSVRYADVDKYGNPTDVDKDGKTGATDVVAVAGSPSIGLVKCDKSPYTLP